MISYGYFSKCLPLHKLLGTFVFPKPQSVAAPVALSIRCYRGSNRTKLKKARCEKLQLEKELEQKYGVSSRPVFKMSYWLKENYEKELDAFQARLGLYFHNERVLRASFIHSSFTDEISLMASSADKDLRLKLRDNSQSEFSLSSLALIGYSLSSAYIKTCLYRMYPNLTPNICLDVREFLIKRETIGELASNLGISELILLSKELEETLDINTEMHLQFTKLDVVSDAFFAVIGAIYVDSGSIPAEKFIEDFLVSLVDFEDLATQVFIEKPADELQEILQLHSIDAEAKARTIVQAGYGSHNPFFLVGVFCNDVQIGEGASYSIKLAREDAFRNALFNCMENNVNFADLRTDTKRDPCPEASKLDAAKVLNLLKMMIVTNLINIMNVMNVVKLMNLMQVVSQMTEMNLMNYSITDDERDEAFEHDDRDERAKRHRPDARCYESRLRRWLLRPAMLIGWTNQSRPVFL